MKQKTVWIFILVFMVGLFPFSGQALAKKKKDKYPKYVGPLKCDSSCHDPWYKAWKETGHGKTYELLKQGVRVEAKKKAGLEDKDYTKNPLCLRCHTTGFGQKGGYKIGDPILPGEPNKENVGCEMCHTTRGGSMTRFTMKEEKDKFKREDIEKDGQRYDYETVCKKCHLHRHSPFQEKVDPKYKFDFKERMKKVHDHEKYYDADNKDQVIEGKHGIGVTESRPLVVEEWEVVKGKIKFKALPMIVKKKKLIQVFQ